MREMVLNHASLQEPNQHIAVEWLKGMAAGMLVLVRDGIVEKTLWMSRSEYETRFMPEWSLWGAFRELQRDRAGYQRERGFIIELLDKRSRILNNIGQSIKGCEVRAVGCEAKELSPQESLPLSFCAINNAIAVGFPSGIWDCDQITVNGETPKTIDNLTRSVHAQTISERHRAGLRFETGAELWRAREEAFPHLKFGLDVEGHLAELDTAALQTVNRRLESLDTWAGEGRAIGSTATPRGAEKVEGRDSTFRLRAGQFRILYTVDRSTIVVFSIARRAIAYR